MNQFTPRHTVDTMARLSNEVYQVRFPNRYLPGHRMFANLHRRLREHGSFNENMKDFGRPRELRDAVGENVLYYFRDNPHQAPELQHVTWEYETTSTYGMFSRTTMDLHPYYFQKV